MPSRKNIKPPPNFSFVTLEYKPKEISWVKVHSGVARSHAAYWGGSAKHRRQGSKQIAGQQGGSTASSSYTEKDSNSHDDAKPTFDNPGAPNVRHRPLTKPKDAKATPLPPQIVNKFLRCLVPDKLQHLPSFLPEIKVAGPAFATGLPTFNFYGEEFVNQFIMFNHEDFSVMFSGCLLQSYAHSMALTGQGSQTILLRLKGHVIRRISDRIKSSEGLLSPRCLTAILALAAPIVCLVSRDLPKSLSVWDYINASMQGSHLCCPESAMRAQSAFNERIIHEEAARKFLTRSHATFQDADSVALFRYISNCLELYVSF
jgi:hypothetical protein